MKLQIGRRDHHHVIYHMDDSVIYGRGDAPLSLEQIVENVLFWCRNTGINGFNLHIWARPHLGIVEYKKYWANAFE